LEQAGCHKRHLASSYLVRDPSGGSRQPQRSAAMLKWAVIFFVISLIAGALGFTGVATGARRISIVLFGVFMAIAIVIVLIAWGIGELII
jgi:uncharacterized membrane protein YtjA (UPF0391 family)